MTTIRFHSVLVVASLLLLSHSGAGQAVYGNIIGTVIDSSGAAVPNAVVTLYPGGRPSPLAPAQGSYQIAQRDLQFSPFVLVVPVGGLTRSARST